MLKTPILSKYKHCKWICANYFRRREPDRAKWPPERRTAQRFNFTLNIVLVTASTIRYKISRGKFSIRTMRIFHAAYIRLMLEFAAAIWGLHQVFKYDIESVQWSVVLLSVLGDSFRWPPFTLAPYKERCKCVAVQPFVEKRLICVQRLIYLLMRILM